MLRIVTAAHGPQRGAATRCCVPAVGWAQRYHFDPARANVLRCLRTAALRRGCWRSAPGVARSPATSVRSAPWSTPSSRCRRGPRWRAPAAATCPVSRCSSVSSPTCPQQPAYDVMVGDRRAGVRRRAATRTSKPYSDFLDASPLALVDGGTLVLAIENKLGVKYLVGSPEDHTNRVFDSIEGYPRGGQARTFSRRELEQMLRGQRPEPRTAHRLPRLQDDPRGARRACPAATRSLLHRIPELPEPGLAYAQRPAARRRAAVWRTLVDAGLETDFGNSFLVLAGKGVPSALWPDDARCDVLVERRAGRS